MVRLSSVPPRGLTGRSPGYPLPPSARFGDAQRAAGQPGQALPTTVQPRRLALESVGVPPASVPGRPAGMRGFLAAKELATPEAQMGAWSSRES